jgi:hypothetical protein
MYFSNNVFNKSFIELDSDIGIFGVSNFVSLVDSIL